jgi:hypothetical protein
MKHLTLTILTFTWMLAACSGAADDGQYRVLDLPVYVP